MKKIKFLIILFALVGAGLSFKTSSLVFASQAEFVSYFKNHSLALEGRQDLTPLIGAAGERRVVLLGEASHGTSEYYRWRKKISRRLIEEKDFSFIVVEGNWPSCFSANLYVKGKLEGDLEKLLRESFQNWPRWMWANKEIVELLEWLREYNLELPPEKRVGFYGMDVYSLKESAEEVRRLIKEFGDEALLELKNNYRCFEPFAYDGFAYAREAFRREHDCRDEVREVVEVLEGRKNLGDENSYDYFNLVINALAVKNAEKYYRTAVRGGAAGWNNRVYHMEEVLRRLLDFYGKESKGIVWAHNTHVGDARATAMSRQQQVNIGQLSRQRLGGRDVFIVGFGTHRGEVVAGSDWGAKLEVMPVPPGKEGSVEDLLSQVDKDSFLTIFDAASRRKDYLTKIYGHRAIGVTYNPRIEQRGNYVPTVMPHRYDAFIFFQETGPLAPLGEE